MMLSARTCTIDVPHRDAALRAPSEGRLRGSNRFWAQKKQSGRPDAGGPDSEMERMWSKRNGRQTNSLGTSSMTHGWVLPPAFALWYSHRSESRSDSRDCYGRPTAPKCKPESNATCGKHAWTIPDAARARRTANAGLGQHRPQSTDFTHHFLVATPLTAHQTLHAAFLCAVPRGATGFALTRTGRGAARRWGALWWLWLAVSTG